jgi:ATP phosphoribosyltransferase
MLLQGALAAETRVGLKMNLPQGQVDRIVELLPSMKNPTVSQLYDPKWVAVEIIVEEKIVRDLIPELKKAGACDIIEYPLNKVIP